MTASLRLALMNLASDMMAPERSNPEADFSLWVGLFVEGGGVRSGSGRQTGRRAQL
jgi:hypothetical protein